jgi:hypothetical protein
LRREKDGEYYLVTPVEKCRIKVVDAPFVVVLLKESGAGCEQSLTFTTNMADEVTVDYEHPLRVAEGADGTMIYAMIRDGLEAKLSRNVYYQLAELLVEENGEMGVWSEGLFFPLMKD